MERVVADVTKKYSKEKNRLLKELLSITHIKTNAKSINNINQRLKEAGYKLIHFEQPYFNGYSDVYILLDMPYGVVRGSSIRVIFDQLNTRIVTYQFGSKDELENCFGSILIDGHINNAIK